jgi:hypothetical protein
VALERVHTVHVDLSQCSESLTIRQNSIFRAFLLKPADQALFPKRRILLYHLGSDPLLHFDVIIRVGVLCWTAESTCYSLYCGPPPARLRLVRELRVVIKRCHTHIRITLDMYQVAIIVGIHLIILAVV